MNSFRLTGLSHEQFKPLFAMNDSQLAELGAIRVTATENPGYPCRISLQDAGVGEELLLLPYAHQPAQSPYRASGPIYVRRSAVQRVLEPDEIPDYVSRRLISVRAYDATHMMLNAEVCEGPAVAMEITRQFADERVAYIHLHNARQGCFSCLVNRA